MTDPQIPWLKRPDSFHAWIPRLIFLLGVALLLPSIWSETSITASDEYVLTFRTPMEIRECGRFLTPYCNKEPRLRKPPLYWLILGAYKTVGVNLVSARIWAILAGGGRLLEFHKPRSFGHEPRNLGGKLDRAWELELG